MFLRASNRKKDGKLHRYWSIVESIRPPGSRQPHQRTLLYLGELNDSQREAWVSAIEVFNTQDNTPQTVALFPSDRTPPTSLSASTISLDLSRYSLSNARQFTACWLGCELWKQLQLDTFWENKLTASR